MMGRKKRKRNKGFLVFLLVISCLLVFSCAEQEQAIEELLKKSEQANAALKTKVRETESARAEQERLFAEFFSTLEALQDSITAIKEDEGMIAMEIRSNYSSDNPDFEGAFSEEEILDDISAIRSRLQNYREQVEEKVGVLAQKERELSGREITVSKLKRIISNLNEQLAERDRRIEELEALVNKQRTEIADIKKTLDWTFYAVGTEKGLKKLGLIKTNTE